MLDNRKRGLSILGADYVAPALPPAKQIIIPNIPTTKSKVGQTLRIVVPGNVSANLKAEIYYMLQSSKGADWTDANILGTKLKLAF